MYFVIAVEQGDATHAFGVRVPDLPGCFTGGDTFDQAIKNAQEAIALHLEGLVEDEEPIPNPSAIDSLLQDPEYQNVIWGLVEVDISKYLGKSEKINITLPSLLIKRIDDHVSRGKKGASRSGFLAEAALEKLARDI